MNLFFKKLEQRFESLNQNLIDCWLIQDRMMSNTSFWNEMIIAYKMLNDNN